MERDISLKRIAALSNAKGPSGFEDEVLALLRRECASLGETERDSLNNLYLPRRENRGGRPVIQLDAHTDEVGFMVHSILPNGLLRFVPLGGWVANTVPAHRVWVKNREGEWIPGVVASKPPHFMSEAEKNAPLSLEQMYIDIGASSDKEAREEYGVAIASPVAPDADFTYDAVRDRMIGKAFDCRSGCAAIVDVLKELSGKPLNVDVVAAFASQEEVGMRGAAVSVQHVQPDAAIVFEGCPADDTFSPDYAIQTAIGKGPMLRHIDRAMITNPRFQKYALELARFLDIPVQESVRTGGATNGSAINLANMGVPVIVIGIPVRYIHTHYGVAAFSDFENAVKLGTALLQNLTEEIIGSF